MKKNICEGMSEDLVTLLYAIVDVHLTVSHGLDQLELTTEIFKSLFTSGLIKDEIKEKYGNIPEIIDTYRMELELLVTGE